jgi:hypothetical protein
MVFVFRHCTRINDSLLNILLPAIKKTTDIDVHSHESALRIKQTILIHFNIPNNRVSMHINIIFLSIVLENN